MEPSSASTGPAVDSADPRCIVCTRKVRIGTIECRCLQPLCARHVAPECHDCKFDYKALGRAIVMTANPKVTTAKLSA